MKTNIFTVANFFSFLRIILTPLFLYFLFEKGPYYELLALFIFVAASVTDAYDGYFARKYKTVSSFGVFLDPLADKVLMSAAFISFVVLGLIPLWMVILVLLRDLLITILRLSMQAKESTMTTRISAKIKTGSQIGVVCFILTYLITQRWNVFYNIKDIIKNYMVDQYHIIYILMLLVTIFTVWTGIEYLIVNKKVIKEVFSKS